MGNSASYLKEVFQEKTDPDFKSSFVRVITDPRSPTAEITRTPIEVDVEARTFRRQGRTVDSSPVSRGSYIQAENSNNYENVIIKFHKLRILENDPRSPTVGIDRTPIEVLTSSENNSSSSNSLKSCKSMDDLSVLHELSSIKLSDPRSPSIEVERTPIQVPVWSDEPEQEDTTPKQRKSVSAKRNKENVEILAKKLFGTPDQKDVPVQVRTPLSTVNSPHQILRAKHCHGIYIGKSRISGTENTPPCLNKYDLASTRLKRCNSSQWGNDSTFII